MPFEIQVPLQPHDNNIIPPVAPANPPSDNDLLEALMYRNKVFSSAVGKTNQPATIGDVGRAIVYEHSVAHKRVLIEAGQGLAPPWFDPVQDQLNLVVEQLNLVRQQLNRMETNVARTTNAANGDGSVFEFAIVPFNNGDDPTGPEHNLPRLTTIQDIDNLSGTQATAYLTGYGIQPIPHAVAARHRLVKIAIGCRAL